MKPTQAPRMMYCKLNSILFGKDCDQAVIG
jgi:hypothetical protein